MAAQPVAAAKGGLEVAPLWGKRTVKRRRRRWRWYHCHRVAVKTAENQRRKRRSAAAGPDELRPVGDQRGPAAASSGAWQPLRRR